MEHVAILKLDGPSGPAPDRSVLDSLIRLDRGLRVAWSEFWLDLTKNPPKPLIREDGKTIPWPRWHVFLKKEAELHHLFIWQDDETKSFRSLSQAVVDKLLTDLGRHHTGDEIADMIEDASLKARAHKKAKWTSLRNDEMKENSTAIKRVMEDPQAMAAAATKRDMQIVSYDGQPIRRTVNDAIEVTPEERGWVRPDYDKELA